MKRKYAEGGVPGEEDSPEESRFTKGLKRRIGRFKESLAPEEFIPKPIRDAKKGLDRIQRGEDVPVGIREALQEMKDAEMRKREEAAPTTKTEMGKIFKKGGKVGSASKRADGCAMRGKTRGKFV
jgi:hypothetical protein